MSGASFIEQIGYAECDLNVKVTNKIVIQDIKKVIQDYQVEESIRIDIKNIPESLKSQHTLEICPSGNSSKNEGYVSLFLESKKADDILIDAKYSIIDQEGDLVINHSTEYDPTK